jgi:hypothetical protein
MCNPQAASGEKFDDAAVVQVSKPVWNSRHVRQRKEKFSENPMHLDLED